MCVSVAIAQVLNGFYNCKLISFVVLCATAIAADSEPLTAQQCVFVLCPRATFMAANSLLHAYRQHASDLLGFLTRRLHCRATAADLRQDLYLRLVQMDEPASIENSRAYLFRMAANLATDHQRVEGRRSELRDELAMSDEEPTTAGPEQALLAREQLERVQQLLGALPPRTCAIFYANRFEGKTQRQIAEEMGISTTTVENHIRQAFAALRAFRDNSTDNNR